MVTTDNTVITFPAVMSVSSIFLHYTESQIHTKLPKLPHALNELAVLIGVREGFSWQL